MSLTVDTLKAFLHETLLEQFPDPETDGTSGDPAPANKTLESAVLAANQSYNRLTGSLPAKAVIRFDSLTFQVKTALCHVYEYVLQDHAMLHALSLQSMSLSERDVFENYFKLLQAERNDIKDMRDELLAEIEDKESDVKNKGVMLYHKFPRVNRRYF